MSSHPARAYIDSILNRASLEGRFRLLFGNKERRRYSRQDALMLTDRSQSAMVIIKIARPIPTFIILKDWNKSGIGFIHGSKHDKRRNIIDADIYETASREVIEEAFYNLEYKCEISKDDLVEVDSESSSKGHGNHYTSIFFKELPEDTVINEGGSEEQEWVREATAKEIDAIIKPTEDNYPFPQDERRYSFLDKHRATWKYLKQMNLHLPGAKLPAIAA
ncbi:hypothetical protein KW791_02455 [Candidatus Parcubacteria bacterium]|nr:hypothetical protein [Candidatus Parcubacteria bacterium]